ncbi:MAG: hypothetical protein HZB46_14865 [Solirubrobacterales bacterium]|nr:hypothetical protein [Solirubrobacterales bacterium]
MANAISHEPTRALALLWQRMFDRPPRALHLEEVTEALVAEAVADDDPGRPRVDVRA